MAFDWLNKFHKTMAKPADYAEKTLAAYRLGMKAKGSIAGVRVIVSASCPETARTLDADAVYHPDDAPRVPLPTCAQDGGCQCVYRPVMSYQVKDDE